MVFSENIVYQLLNLIHGFIVCATSPDVDYRYYTNIFQRSISHISFYFQIDESSFPWKN